MVEGNFFHRPLFRVFFIHYDLAVLALSFGVNLRVYTLYRERERDKRTHTHTHIHAQTQTHTQTHRDVETQRQR